jgi:arylsulfatase
VADTAPADMVRPWNTLNADEKKLFARMAEVYAGFSEYTDVQVGRIIEYLENTKQLENTIVFYCADNGASGEGTPNGSVNENKFFTRPIPTTLAGEHEDVDQLAAPTRTTTIHGLGDRVQHAVPDVQALFAVLRRYLRSARDPPGPRASRRRARCASVPPLDRHRADDPRGLRLEMPKVYRGVEQYPLNGVSMRYTSTTPARRRRRTPVLRDARHARHLGGRLEGRGAARTDQRRGPFRPGRWELYHVDVDRSESRNLAKEHPEKLKALIDAWFEEAKRTSCCRSTTAARRALWIDTPTPSHRGRGTSTTRHTSAVPEGVAVNSAAARTRSSPT